jgi:DNA-binding transcriptional MerR regulator
MLNVAKKGVMRLNTLNVKSCYLGNTCFIGCKDFRKGKCKGYWKTLKLGNENIRIPCKYEFEENLFYNISMKIKKMGYVSKQELFKILSDQYDLEFSSRNLQYYVDKKLIEPGIIERFPGVSGSVSFYKKTSCLKIVCIQELIKKHGLTLEDIKKYINLVYNFNSRELANYNPKRISSSSNDFQSLDLDSMLDKKVSRTEMGKFFTFLDYFSCAEAEIKFNIEKFRCFSDFHFYLENDYPFKVGYIKVSIINLAVVNDPNFLLPDFPIPMVTFKKGKIEIINTEG